MSVVGVDTNSYGFAWYRTGRTPTSGFHENRWEQNVDVRRIQAFWAFRQMLVREVHLDDWLVMEEPLALKNGKTTRVLCLMAGALWAAHAEICDGLFVWADVAAWKKQTVGSGNAAKSDIAVWAIHELQLAKDGWGLQRATDCPDLYDAYAIARYGQQLREETGD